VSDLWWLKRRRRPAIPSRISRDVRQPCFAGLGRDCSVVRAHRRIVQERTSSPSIVHRKPRSDREGRRRAWRQRRKLGREANGVNAISGRWLRSCFRVRENNAENMPDDWDRQSTIMQDATKTMLVRGRRRGWGAIHINWECREFRVWLGQYGKEGDIPWPDARNPGSPMASSTSC
jgi:hypothetical protein